MPRRFFIFPISIILCSFYFFQKSEFTPEPAIRLSVPVNHLAEYPDIAIDPDGTIWIVHMQMIEQQEQIVLRAFRHEA
jgi:hypothetical protein